MRNIIKKIKYVWTVFKWFVWYNLMNGEAKKVWHLFKSLAKHAIFKTPYAAIIETSNTCNFRCPTCPTPHKLIHARRPPAMMDLEKFKKIIDNIKNYVHIAYLYNSNEPLLHPDIVEMIKYASQNNLHTMISTNCLLLDEKKTEELLISGLGEARVALDGLKKESYEGFRGGGNFETVKKNIEYLCRRKAELRIKRPIITLQFILNKLNQDEIPAIKEFAAKNKIDKLYIKPFILSEYAYGNAEIKELGEKFLADKDIYDDAIVYKKEGGDLKPKKIYEKCPDVNRVFTVLADGRAVMCCFDLLGDYVYGELDEMGLKDLWFSKKARDIRTAAYKRKFPLCKVCGNIE
ncbi:radical SAM protein [Candidatus Falkowbacteria bacterium]|nr:radical SAM protein [Candidatus Falkowbacteria bacterium]